MSLDNASNIVVSQSSLKNGEVFISGFKHSAVMLMMAAFNLPTRITIDNVPHIEDTEILTEIFRLAGGEVEFKNHRMILNLDQVHYIDLPNKLTSRIHGSTYLIAAFLARFGKVKFGQSGGCQIGDWAQGYKRPMHHVYSVLEKFGACFEYGPNEIFGICDKLSACEIDILDYSESKDELTGHLVSGSTKTALLAAMNVSQGVTRIKNPLLMPETIELIHFLNQCGYKITFHEKEISITKGTIKKNRCFEIMADYVEMFTYVTLGVVHGISLNIYNQALKKMRPFVQVVLAENYLKEMGVELHWKDSHINLCPPATIKGINIDVVSAGFCTDLQPFFALMLLKANQPSTIRERVWRERFDYAHELVKMGAHIKFFDNLITLYPSQFKQASQPVDAKDLRAAAVLVIASLKAPGKTKITNVTHLKRGYESFLEKISFLGGQIEKV